MLRHLKKQRPRFTRETCEVCSFCEAYRVLRLTTIVDTEMIKGLFGLLPPFAMPHLRQPQHRCCCLVFWPCAPCHKVWLPSSCGCCLLLVNFMAAVAVSSKKTRHQCGGQIHRHKFGAHHCSMAAMQRLALAGPCVAWQVSVVNQTAPNWFNHVSHGNENGNENRRHGNDKTVSTSLSFINHQHVCYSFLEILFSISFP